MPLRRRLALIAAAAVGIAAVAVAVASYVALRQQLSDEVDVALRRQADRVREGPFAIRATPFGVIRARPIPELPPREGGPAAYVQLVAPDGAPIAPPGAGGIGLPVDARSREIAARGEGEELRDATVDDTHVRLLSSGLPGGGAVMLGRSLQSVDDTLAHLRLVLLLVVAGGVALAAALGALASRRIIAPIVRLTHAARRISETEDLSERIEAPTRDEVGELALRFNAMLATLAASRSALDESVSAQRQLVADASHELRTPITSLRTNLEVLLSDKELAPDARRALLHDLVYQSEELSALVGDLIELARGEEREVATEDVRLDRVADEAVERARRHASDVDFTTVLEPVVVNGSPDRLARAVNNLLDNAAKHTRPGTPVEVIVDRDGVSVRDHGEGLAEEDLPHVFDRFFRGAGARARPGSGLGLAIVRQVAEAHGGGVSAANAPGGGALFRMRLPTAPAQAPSPAPVA